MPTPICVTCRRSMQCQKNGFYIRDVRPCVISTDVWATGVDFEQLSVLVRADDRDSDIVDVQGPGRVSRIYTAPDGTRKEVGEVIDCMDTFDPTFYRKSLGRRNSYKLLGWEQNWHDAQRSWRNGNGGGD